MEEKQWVDFKAIKMAVSMEQVVRHYDLFDKCRLKQSGERGEHRGACPIHGGAKGSRDFSVNLIREIFNCFSCKARGNILDLVAAMEGCSVRDAALKLAEWFKVGEREPAPATESPMLTLQELVKELDSNSAKVAYYASLVESNTSAIKKLVAAMTEDA